MQRNFEPMRKQVEAWQRSELTDVTAKVVIYEAFVEGKLEAPKHPWHNVSELKLVRNERFTDSHRRLRGERIRCLVGVPTYIKNCMDALTSQRYITRTFARTRPNPGQLPEVSALPEGADRGYAVPPFLPTPSFPSRTFLV